MIHKLKSANEHPNDSTYYRVISIWLRHSFCQSLPTLFSYFSFFYFFPTLLFFSSLIIKLLRHAILIVIVVSLDLHLGRQQVPKTITQYNIHQLTKRYSKSFSKMGPILSTHSTITRKSLTQHQPRFVNRAIINWAIYRWACVAFW